MEDPDSSDDEDSDDDNDDDAGDDAQAINHISVTENTNSGRQERVNQPNANIINHIMTGENTNERRQETVNAAAETNVDPGGRTQIVSPATAGITSSTVEQVARGHTIDGEGRRRTTRKSKKPENYVPSHTNKKYLEGTIHINTYYMRKHEPMKDFTNQDQVEHVLGSAMAQVYSLKK